ncbi:hypothetical protein BIV08_21455 [Pseudomonas sp. AF76]|nr:hypothetical protein BIV09_18595 [Pseudomonas sp. 7SR1]ROO36864.1 hypothetical protein BIV08_21455 [Pseudomonas sp. AF76]
MEISLSARNLPHRESICVGRDGSFVQWIIPEWPNHFLFDIRSTDTDVLERLVAQSGEQFTLMVQFIPAAKLVQQIAEGKPME